MLGIRGPLPELDLRTRELLDALGLTDWDVYELLDCYDQVLL